MSTSTNPTVNGTSIELLYESYLNGEFIVNRKYQRKLVWTLSEKTAFIDSILNNYPTPLILVAQYSDSPNMEIIDGLQRLNAIFSYIDGRYGLEGESPRYFNPEEFSKAPKFSEHKQREYITKDECAKILRYVLPISIYRISESEDVEEVFRRLNSNGRHLSKQEIRQAGSTNRIANLVRKISAQIRGDGSLDDVVPLKSMQKISLTDDSSMGEGIQFTSTFWLKQGILDKEWLRQSKDEEIVLDIILTMLLGVNTSYDSREFDSVYESIEGKPDLVSKVNSYSGTLEDSLSQRFREDIDVFNLIYPDNLDKFSINFAGRKSKVPRYFESLFFAIDHILHVDHKEIISPMSLRRRLEGIGTDALSEQKKNRLWIPSGSGVWKEESRRHNFELLREILGSSEYSRPSSTPSGSQASAEREARIILSQSKLESSRIEFKQGFSIYDPSSEKFINNNNVIEKIAKTACAMSNSVRNGSSYIFIGVCDDKDSAYKFSELSGKDTIEYEGKYICGLEADIEINGSVDQVIRRFSSKFKSLPLSVPHFAEEILCNYQLISIKDRKVMMLKINPYREPVFYDEKMYIRTGPQNSKVDIRELTSYIAKNFELY